MRIYKIRRWLIAGGESEDLLIAASNFHEACRIGGPNVVSCEPIGKLVNAEISALRDWCTCIEELGENYACEEGVNYSVRQGTCEVFNPKIHELQCIRKNKLYDQCTHDALPSSNFCFCHQDERP